MRVLRSTVAAWLLVAFVACYAAPIFAGYRTRGRQCCTTHACCRKNGARNTSAGGSSFAASPDCGQGCRLPAGAPALSSAALNSQSVAFFAAISQTLHPQGAERRGLSSYFAFLYQRPPPSRF